MLTTTLEKKLTLGYLLPRLLIVAGLLDVALRLGEVSFGPPKESRSIPHSTTPDAPFEKNVRLHLAGIYGDLANIANLRDGSEIRSLQFSTDALGFRNTGATEAVKGVVFGDSFSVTGDRDEDSLPAQLGRRLGCRIYNGAGLDNEFRRPSAARVNSVAERIGLDGGNIIITELERRSLERIRTQNAARARTFRGRVQNDFRRLVRSSPVQRYAADALRAVYNDRILPNVYADNIVRIKLRNGDIMSFLPIELRPPTEALPVPVDYWTTLKRELRKSERKFFIVLIPNKYTVYQRLVADPRRWPMYGEQLLARNEAVLRSLEIPVLNLAPALTARAEAGIDKHNYVYWRNDTHWNSEGISVAAEEIARAFPELRKSCNR